MKRSCLTIAAVLLLVVAVNAQTLSPQVIASGGGFFETSIGSLSWTLGEPVTETFTNGGINVILTQGFQQPEKLSTGISEVVLDNVSVNIYPNPAETNVLLEFSYDKSDRISIEIVDMLGRTLTTDQVDVYKDQEVRYDLDVSNFAGGMYLVRLTNESGELLGTYKLQKVR